MAIDGNKLVWSTRKRQRIYLTEMPLESGYFPTSTGLPELHRTVPARGRKYVPGAVERHGNRHYFVTFERCELLATDNVPELDGFVQASRGERTAVRTKGKTMNPACVTEKSSTLLSRSNVPELNGPIPTCGG